MRLAELVAALSLATDLGMGQPMEHALRTCLLAVRLAQALGVGGDDLADVYYVALLRYVGCTADAHETAALAGGDDLGFASWSAPLMMGDRRPWESASAPRSAGGPLPPARGAPTVIAGTRPPSRADAARALTAHCEVAEMLARRLGLRPTVRWALRHAFERWDGEGFPEGLAGEAVPLAVRVCAVARDAELLYRQGGLAMACDVIRQRSGQGYDPRAAQAFLRHGAQLLTDGQQGQHVSAWEATLAAEPGRPVWVPSHRLHAMLEVFADFADVKCPWMQGHSRGVAALAAAAARHSGLGDAAVVAVRHAGLLHDLGRTGVANGIWDKPGPLTTEEWERVRLHPYLTERILVRCGALAALAPLAAAHHERLDGSGYYRGSTAAWLSREARLLAAADAYQAMTQERPHRSALSAAGAAAQLAAEAAAGRLDPQAVEAVTAAAGGPPGRAVPRSRPAGLSEREVEVLRLVCRGCPNRVIAERLGITAKTVGHHVQHIYDKIGLSSRAAAAVFALEHGLLATGEP
ncbi:MAG TPA: HD domain-containing phosphohydrolase [Chloroflexota bacterium]|nr:HD domain-containing phosphohydrolase [Chloroflexota bacterium]